MYKPQLDGLRCFCFLAVFFAHCYFDDFWYGGFGVQVFFVMSGFLITRILLASEPRPLGRAFGVFYVRRALRVFPIYYLLILILALLGSIRFVPWHLTYTFNVYAFYLSAHDRLGEIMRHWSSSGLHFWSLCVEEQFYLIYPLVIYLSPVRWRLGLVAAGIAASIGARCWFAAHYPNAFYGALLPVCGEYILWGCLFAMLDRKRALGWLPPRVAIYGAAAAFAGLVQVARPKFALGPVFAQFIPVPDDTTIALFYQTFYAVAFALVIWGLWQDDRNEVARFLSFRPFAYLGKISYGLYLIHLTTWELAEPIQQRIPWLKSQPPEATYLVLLVITITLGALSWHLYESPVNDLKARFSYRRRGDADAADLPARPD